MGKKIISLFLLTCVFSNFYSQVGIATDIIPDGVMVQMGTQNKGFLPPRIPLISRTSVSPLPANIPTGTIVFNTSTTGNFPNLITPGIYWWSAEDKQWTGFNTNVDTVTMKYTNSETSTNYNTTNWQNVKLFGNLVYNESSHIYSVNTSAHTLTVKRQGLYSISSLLSFDRLSSSINSMVSMAARIYVNGNPVGTEQIFSPEETASINGNRGLFSHSFTEYLQLNANDVISVRIKKTSGTFSAGYGDAAVQFHAGGDSSIAVSRIR